MFHAGADDVHNHCSLKAFNNMLTLGPWSRAILVDCKYIMMSVNQKKKKRNVRLTKHLPSLQFHELQGCKPEEKEQEILRFTRNRRRLFCSTLHFLVRLYSQDTYISVRLQAKPEELKHALKLMEHPVINSYWCANFAEGSITTDTPEIRLLSVWLKLEKL